MTNALLSLLHLTDLSLPIGGFSHSAGLETYVQQGIVKDTVTATSFVEQMLSQNLYYTDAAFLSLAYDAAEDAEQIVLLDNECTTVKIPKEIRQASHKLAARLLKIFQPLHTAAYITQYAEGIKNNSVSGHYCIAFALCAKAMGVKKKEALTGFYYNAAAGITTNAVKLIPLSQQAGQTILFKTQALIQTLVEKSMTPDRSLVGLCCTGFDIKSMQHERLYSRLYMS
jgi:urease accessory protein